VSSAGGRAARCEVNALRFCTPPKVARGDPGGKRHANVKKRFPSRKMSCMGSQFEYPSHLQQSYDDDGDVKKRPAKPLSHHALVVLGVSLGVALTSPVCPAWAQGAAPPADVTPPVVIDHVDPVYPASALPEQKHADVVLALTVDVDGHVALGHHGHYYWYWAAFAGPSASAGLHARIATTGKGQQKGQ